MFYWNLHNYQNSISMRNFINNSKNLYIPSKKYKLKTRLPLESSVFDLVEKYNF